MIGPYEVVVLLAAGFFYILFAGGYASLFTYGKIKGDNRFKYASFLLMGAMIYCAYVMVSSPIFSIFWKGLISFATLAYMLIPHGMWWVIVRVHRVEEEERRKKNQPNLPVM